MQIGLGLSLTQVRRAGVAYDGPDYVIVGYGQSNWLRHTEVSDNPPAALPGTVWWGDDGWTDVPAANGARGMLNTIAAATGRSVGLISGGHGGVNLDALQKGAGTGYFEELEAKMIAAGIRHAPRIRIAKHHGEGSADSAAPASSPVYAAGEDTLHGSLAGAIGKSRAQVPMIVSSLAGWVGGLATDASWNAILNAQVTAHQTYPHIHYSHSNRPATVSGDGAHWDTALFYERSGILYAHTMLWLDGIIPDRPNWTIEAVEIVDATHTDVHLAHSMGTDFTPTSGITGFTLSINGFATTIVPSAAVRLDADTIRLTHSALAVTANRAVRYQYGKLPDISAPVRDNSPLAVPLNHSAGQSLIAPGSAAEPVLVHIAANSDQFGSGGQVQGLNALDLTIAADTTFIVAVSHASDGVGVQATDVTITPNGGSAIAGTLLYRPATGAAPYVEFWRVDVPAATAGMNNADLRVTLAAHPFARFGYAIAAVNTGDVSSWTPVDTGTSTGTGTDRTLELTTSAGGFVYAVAATTYSAGPTTATWTGDEPPIEASDFTNSFGLNFTTAIANGCAAHTGDNTVTATYANSSAMRLSAISIR